MIRSTWGGPHVDVALHRLVRFQRSDADRVAALAERGHRGAVAKPHDQNPQTPQVDHRHRAHQIGQLLVARHVRAVRPPVGGQDRKRRPGVVLRHHIRCTEIEVVVADRKGVDADLREHPHLGLPAEAVEDRRPLEHVSGVEVNDPARALPLPFDQGGQPRRSPEGGVLQLQTVGLDGGRRVVGVGQNTRVDVGGVQHRERDIALAEVHTRSLDQTAGQRGRDQDRDQFLHGSDSLR